MNRWVRYLVAVMLLSSSLLAHAADARGRSMPLGCIGIAAREYGLPPRLLYALYLTEGGTLGRKIRNASNGTYDHGPFQINTIWLGKLAPYGIDEDSLTYNPLVNARTAAWRLRSEIILANNNVWRGVGNYRSRTQKYHQEQVYRVAAYYQAIPEYTNYQGTC